MTLSNALSNALSGLNAASRATEVVSNNLANALTPGFARREIELSPRNHIAGGGGVQVDGVSRFVRTGVVGQSRLAAAESARLTTLSDHAVAMEKMLGVPGEPGALTTRLDALAGALVAATTRPDSEPVLLNVIDAVRSLTDSLNAASDQVQAARTTADAAIAADIRSLNEGLLRVAALNRQITAQRASGTDSGALEDQRQGIVDELAAIVPLREYPRAGGSVALFTVGGGLLLDGSQPIQLALSAAAPVTAGMSVENGLLSRPWVDGEAMTASQLGLYGGGRLAAHLEIRDRAAPALQAQLDAIALDLHDRFADPVVDPTIAADSPGLLTDGGVRAAAGNGPGLAGRLQLNAAVDPQQGGEAWRLRDGVGAATAGPVGDSSLIVRLKTALEAQRLPGAGGTSAIERSASVLIADITTGAATTRLNFEAAQAGATAQADAFVAALRADGVDSDNEMQRLLELERAYSANAKIFKAVDEMLQTILGL